MRHCNQYDTFQKFADEFLALSEVWIICSENVAKLIKTEHMCAFVWCSTIRFITIPKMHHVVDISFLLLTTDRITLRTKRHRKCHKPEPVGIFCTVWYVNLFDQWQVAKKEMATTSDECWLMVLWRILYKSVDQLVAAYSSCMSAIATQQCVRVLNAHAAPGCYIIGLFHFLVECQKKCPNQILSFALLVRLRCVWERMFLFVGIMFLCVCVGRGVIYYCYLGFVLVCFFSCWFSSSVQVIGPKWPIMCRAGRETLLTRRAHWCV